MVILYDGNFLAVVVMSVVTFLFGWLWYSFIMRDAWKQAMKFSKAQMNSKPKNMGALMFGMFLLNTLTMYIIAVVVFVFGATTFGDGAVVGFLLWAGFSITAVAESVAWGMKSKSLFYINGLYGLIIFLVSAGVFALW